MGNLRQKIAHKLAHTKLGNEAVTEKADLSGFKKRPSFRVLMGIILIGFSYVIGWPAISVLAFISYTYETPLLIVVGGPVLYGISHLVFFLGLYMAGQNYAKIFFRWAVRRTIEKHGSDETEKR